MNHAAAIALTARHKRSSDRAGSIGVPITEKIGCYFEYFGLYTDGLASDFPAHFIDGGFTYLLNYDTQFDIRAGHGINDAAEDFFGGIGLSKRF